MSRFVMAHPEARKRAMSAVADAPEGYVVRVEQPTRNSERNAKFHAICSELAGREWLGKPRTGAQWKVLLVSGHAVATKHEAEIVPGLEGEFINLRESTALMSVKRSSSLIEYAQAYLSEITA